MTYGVFHLVFILPIIGVLLYLNHRAGAGKLPRFRLLLALIVVMALVYTTPWDNYLIARGIWSYNLDRIFASARIGYVPLEEYAFFILQPVLTGLYLLFFSHRYPDDLAAFFQSVPRQGLPRWLGGGLALGAGLLGMLALIQGGTWTYFGLILVWASPVLALHWFYGGDYLWRARRIFWASLVSATVYLWVVDRIALEWKIWSISPQTATGWNLLGLPLEEALFFLVTNLLVLQGLLLFFHLIGPEPEKNPR